MQRKKFRTVSMNEELYLKIENYRFEKRIKSMIKAVNHLIEDALEAEKEKGVTEAATSSRHVQQPQITDGDRLDER